MRITISLNDHDHARLKEIAEHQGKTLSKAARLALEFWAAFDDVHEQLMSLAQAFAPKDDPSPPAWILRRMLMAHEALRMVQSRLPVPTDFSEFMRSEPGDLEPEKVIELLAEGYTQDEFEKAEALLLKWQQEKRPLSKRQRQFLQARGLLERREITEL